MFLVNTLLTALLIIIPDLTTGQFVKFKCFSAIGLRIRKLLHSVKLLKEKEKE